MVDGSGANFNKAIDTISETGMKVTGINTEHLREEAENAYLLNEIEAFSKSSIDVLLVKYSGRDSVAEEVGSDRPEMIISLSYNGDKQQYAEDPIKTILDFLLCEKETV